MSDLQPVRFDTALDGSPANHARCDSRFQVKDGAVLREFAHLAYARCTNPATTLVAVPLVGDLLGESKPFHISKMCDQCAQLACRLSDSRGLTDNGGELLTKISDALNLEHGGAPLVLDEEVPF